MKGKKAYILEEVDKALREKYNAKVLSIDKFKSLNTEISSNPEKGNTRNYILFKIKWSHNSIFHRRGKVRR